MVCLCVFFYRGGVELKIWKAILQHRQERPNNIDHHDRNSGQMDDLERNYDYDETAPGCKCTNGEIADNIGL